MYILFWVGQSVALVVVKLFQDFLTYTTKIKMFVSTGNTRISHRFQFQTRPLNKQQNLALQRVYHC